MRMPSAQGVRLSDAGRMSTTWSRGILCARREFRGVAPRHSPRPAVRWALLAILAAGAGPIRAQASEGGIGSAPPLVGMTRPYREAVLGTVHQGLLQQFHVEEGGSIAAGAPVAGLDDSVQRARVRIAQAEAESSLEVELTRTRLDHAQREYDRLSRLYGDDSASSKELTDADEVLRTRRLEHEIAKFEAELARRNLDREARTLEQFTIRAPFSGVVLERLKQVGESVDFDEGVVRMAQLDPLLVVLDCPLEHRSAFAVGERVSVGPMAKEYAAREGVIHFVSPVADGGSQTFRVKIAVHNPDGAWIAGLKVAVYPKQQDGPGTDADAGEVQDRAVRSQALNRRK